MRLSVPIEKLTGHCASERDNRSYLLILIEDLHKGVAPV